jgi:hypothetical protein
MKYTILIPERNSSLLKFVTTEVSIQDNKMIEVINPLFLKAIELTFWNHHTCNFIMFTSWFKKYFLKIKIICIVCSVIFFNRNNFLKLTVLTILISLYMYIFQMPPGCCKWQDFLLYITEKHPILYICNIFYPFIH